MATVKRPYGKDDPSRFISGALTGGGGPSEMIDREGDPSRSNDQIRLPDGQRRTGDADRELGQSFRRYRRQRYQPLHSLTGSSAVQD